MALSANIKSRLPRIALIGSESLAPDHGTGMMFARHLSNYPRSKILDVFYRSAGGKSFFRSLHIKAHDLVSLKWNDPLLRTMNRSIESPQMRTATSLVYGAAVFEPVSVDWKKYGGPPDLIYSTCFASEHFAFLHHFYRSLPKKVPILQHFLDLYLKNEDSLKSYYAELAPNIVDVWSLTLPMAKYAQKLSGVKPKIVQALHQKTGARYRTEHREFSDDFNCILIGNLWSPSAYESMRTIWGETGCLIRDLPTIRWSGHPRRLDLLKAKSLALDEALITNEGLLSERELASFLRNADIALIPFCGKEDDQQYYAKYSLPSRIGDYCLYGIPIVAISRQDTEPARIIREKGLGIVLDPSRPGAAARKLAKFLRDRKWREECGKNCRLYMERELDLEKYQKELYGTLIELASRKVSQSSDFF